MPDNENTKVIESLRELEKQALQELENVTSKDSLIQYRSKFLGKKGKLKEILSTLKDLSIEDRKKVGLCANAIQEKLESFIVKKQEECELDLKLGDLEKGIDIFEPAFKVAKGSLHPLSKTSDDILNVLRGLGFSEAVGPEVEYDFYNFQALNIPKNHPARDMQDTFYISDDILLRTHTSPVQIRAMLAKKKPPLRILSFGRVYRRDEDATHSPMFHQIEGLCVSKDVSMADLKGTLEIFVAEIFSKKAKIRMRPSFFPFTEPSIEVDVSCFACTKGANCRLCKNTGWIEILGAGMVDPNVFIACGIDAEKYKGFAFGVGVERVCMLRMGVPDIKLFFENDLRFLRQF